MRTMNEFKLSGSLKTVYCSLVRSMLEYASVLWDPFVVIDSCHLERVQRRFLSSAAYMLKIVHPPHDYTPVLRAFGLTFLADRRVKANLAFLKKLIDGSLNAPSLLVQVKFLIGPQGLELLLLYPYTVPITVKTNLLTARCGWLTRTPPFSVYLNIVLFLYIYCM